MKKFARVGFEIAMLNQNYKECLCQFVTNQKPDKFQEKSKNFKHLTQAVAKLQQF